MRTGQGAFITTGLQWISGCLQEVSAPPTEGRYLTVVQVRDYHCLMRHTPGGSCLDSLTADDLAAVAAGRTCIILDLSNEGPALASAIFDDLHAQLAEKSIPRSAALFVSQNRRIHRQYEKAYGKGIGFATFDFFPVACATWFDSARGIASFGAQGFSPEGYAPLSDPNGPVFLCQNAAVRWHRVLLYRWLTLAGLSPDGLVSFHGISCDNPKGREIDLNAPPPGVAAAFPELIADIADWIPRQPQRFDQETRFGNDLVLTLDASAFARTRLSIVTETDFFYGEVERITEKALKAACMGHPLLIVGAPRSLAFLRELGFTTFDGVIDQRYDTIEDPIERLSAVFASIKGAVQSAKEDPERWRRQVIEESLANYGFARNGLQRRIGQVIAAPLLAQLRTFLHSGALFQS